MEERQKKAFDFAADLTKQLITLATAVLTFTITFAKGIPHIEYGEKVVLMTSWICYILSVGAGIFTLMSLTGNLDPIPRKNMKINPILTITSSNVISKSKLQIFLFLAGLLCSCINGCQLLFN